MIEVQVVDRSWSNEWGPEITTLQLRYPRFLLAQFNTHRVFSRSTASSRAIPVEKSIARVVENPYIPQHWGANRPGMQSSDELDASSRKEAEEAWYDALEQTVRSAEKMVDAGVHKQWANRILEPFSYAETVVTSTEWDWFFQLRCHQDSQPEMQELANRMKDCVTSDSGIAWRKNIHLPYVSKTECLKEGVDVFDAMMVSAARCARVSYLNHDQSHPCIDKDLSMANRLWSDRHLSPFEHTAIHVGWGKFANLSGWVSLRTMMERVTERHSDDAAKEKIREMLSSGEVPDWMSGKS